MEELGLGNHVIFTGFVEDKELAHLYNAASLLVFPSLEEGFGLPAIEAMACGTPVVASNSGSLPEVLGDAGRFFDPRNTDQMLEAIRNALSDDSLREKMKNAGLDRAKQFQWNKASDDLLSIFEEVIGR